MVKFQKPCEVLWVWISPDDFATAPLTREAESRPPTVLTFPLLPDKLSAMNISDLSAAQLSQAANIQAQIEKLQGDLASILGTGTPAAVAPTPAIAPAPVVAAVVSKKGTMSAEGRARVKAAQIARWAKIKADNTTPTPAVTTKPITSKQSTMTPAAKALLSAKLKAYWAKRKAAKK